MCRSQPNQLQMKHSAVYGPGNPGTGKTEMARAIAALLYDLDIVRQNAFVEVQRTDLVGEHSGDTEEKTAEQLRRAEQLHVVLKAPARRVGQPRRARLDERLRREGHLRCETR